MGSKSADDPHASEPASGDDMEKLLAKNDPDLARDILWTYENLSNQAASPQTAPSAGAWAMLERDGHLHQFWSL